jgi:plasmid maintenance system antidote protein VapI
MATLESDRLVSPREIVAEELEERGMTQPALAKTMGRPIQAINGIIMRR